MTFDPTEPAATNTLGSLNPGDIADQGSLFEAYQAYKNRSTGPEGITSGSPFIHAPSAGFPRAEASTAWAMRTYDPDPFGDQNKHATLPPNVSGPVDSNFVRGMVVAGKYMTRAQLQESEDGRAILADAITGRTQTKRGFFEAVMDFKKTDIPFFTLFGTVGNRLDRASEASAIMHKVSNGEEITDDERMLLGRMVMEQSRQSSLGGKIGDIVRQAPGFIFEFLATDGILSMGRAAAARTIGAGSVKAASILNVNRGTKILANELAETELTNLAVAKVGANATRKEISAFVRGMDEAAKSELAGRISASINQFARTTMGERALPAGKLGKLLQTAESAGTYSADFISAVSDNIARKAVASAVAKQGASTLVGQWARGTASWASEHGARALLDFGTWGTENSTMLSTKLGLRGAIADSLGATFIEAPLRGLEMYGVNYAARQGISALAGTDIVSRSQLDLEAAALKTNNKRLMDMAPYISMGQDLLEYVSENAGRGFTSTVRAAGIATGLAKPAERALIGEVGGILRRGKEAEAGGFLRQLLKKALGSTEEYARRTGDVQFRAAKKALKGKGISDEAIRSMVRAQAVPEALHVAVGSDYKSFMKAAIKGAYDGKLENLAYKTHFRYAIADFMARNNFGPTQTLNAFQRMGYDGVLAEMYEERYSDFAKALLGLDDKKTHSLKENISRAFAAVSTELEMEDLIAEAVGFAFPAAVRTSTLSIQRVLGGDDNISRARAAGRNFTDANIGMAVIEDTFGTFNKVMSERRSALLEERKAANDELDATRGMLAERGITDQTVVNAQTSQQVARVSDLDKAIAAHDKYVTDTLKANSIEDAAKVSAGKLMRFAASPLLRNAGEFASKISTVYSSEQLAEAQAAQDALLEDAGFLGEAYDMARQFDTAEDNISLMRKTSSKLLGIAAAIICGEPALAQSNSIKWAAVDEGFDPHIAEDLGNLHRSMREKVIADMKVEDATHTPAREEVEKRIRDAGYEQKAKDLVRSRLLLSGVRMFAHSEMLDRAAIHVAEGLGYWYDASRGVLVNNAGETTTIKQFATSDEHKAKVENLRDQIGLETLRMLTDSDSVLRVSKDSFVSYLRLKPGDSSVDQTARVLAADLAGFGSLISQRELAKGVKVDDLLAADSTAIPEDLVKMVNQILMDNNGDETKVPDALAERLAHTLQIPLGDMTENTMAARRRQAIQVAKVASGILTGNVRTFIKHIDIGESRLVDDPVRTIYFTKNEATGMWVTTDNVRDDKTLERSVTFEGDDAKLEELIKSEGLEELEGRRIVLTPARSLTTTDPILMLQKLGAADAVMRAGRTQTGAGYDYSRVHPALRINDETQAPLLTDAEVATTLRREMFMAEYAMTHKNLADYNFGGEAWSDEVANRCEQLRAEYEKMYENVLGERGYMTIIEQTLTSLGVSTPSTMDVLHQAPGRKLANSYSIGLSQYSARRRSSAHYVSVNYGAGVDTISSMVTSAVIDGFNKYGARLFGAAATPTAKNAVQTFFQQMHQLVEAKLRTADYGADQREALKRLRDGVTRAYQSPSPRAIALFATAYSCGQLPRARALGYHATTHDMALAILEQEAKSLPSYIGFTAVVDLLLGGSAFSQMQALREAGQVTALENTGIGRILNLTGAAEYTNADAMSNIKPAGMSWSDFEQKVNEYAAANFKDRVAPGKQKATQAEPGSEFGRIRKLFANAGFADFNQIRAFLVSLGKLTPFRENVDKITEMKDNLDRAQIQFDALTEELNSLRQRLADLTTAKERQDNSASDSEIEATKDRLTKVSAARKDTADEIAELKADIDGGVSGMNVEATRTLRDAFNQAETAAMTTATGEQATDNDEDNFDDNGLYSVDVRDPETTDAHIHYETSEGIDGTMVVRVLDDVETSVEFDQGAKETTAKTVVSAILAADPDATITKENFFETIDDFTGGSVPLKAKEALFNYYELLGKNEVLGLDRDGHPLDSSTVSEEENEASTEHNFGDKYLAAFANKTLDHYLSFYRYVAAQNGREFLAGINGIRDNISVLRERLGDSVSSDLKLDMTLRALDALFNSETVNDEGINGHPDREALFTSRVRELETGAFGVTVDDMIAKLMEHDDTGHPRFRQAAFFLSFVRNMAPEARRRFMTLACSSVATHQVGITRQGDGSLTLSQHSSHRGSVSTVAATGSFTVLLGKSSKQLTKMANDLVARLNATDENGVLLHNFAAPAKEGTKVQVLTAAIARVLAPTIGYEAPIIQALTSPCLFDAIRRGLTNKSLGRSNAPADELGSFCRSRESGKPVDAENLPPLVNSVYKVIKAYANWLAIEETKGAPSDTYRRQKLDSLVVTEFSTHLGTGSAASPDKDMSQSTEWSRVLSAYSSGLPATVVTANTLPNRNNRLGSKVVIALQDAPPVIRQFVDKDITDDTGFAFHAYRVWLGSSEGKAQIESGEESAKTYFLEKVLPVCRQRLIWPDDIHSELLAKTVDRDYTRSELYEACSNNFASQWFTPASEEAAGKKPTLTKSTNWYVPVYNGDHSAGVILRLPTSVLTSTIADNLGQLGKLGKTPVDIYRAVANRVNKWLGLDAFGTDTKRASLACSEFPGRAMRGVRYNNGKLEKGECRIHVVHNYGMEGHNDAFLGTTLATGYGLRAQQDTAKDINTLTHKLHVMSAAGVDLTMIKSLITAMWDYSGKQTEGVDPARVRGTFLNGMATKALMDYIIDFRKNDADISTSMLVDEDSMKVGILNSKAMGHESASAEKGFEPLIKYIFAAIKAHTNGKSALSGEALDKALCDNWLNGAPVADADGKFRFGWVTSSGEKTRKTIGELLGQEEEGSIQVNVVNGLSGDTLDFSYADNSLMSYAVANVSHQSHASMEHMPRNNAVDGMVMGQGMIRDGLVKDSSSIREGIRAMSAWGLLNSVISTCTENLNAARDRGTCAYKIANGADPNSAEVTEQATRDIYSKLVKDIKPPLAGMACPLVSSGAVYHEFTKEELKDRAKQGLPPTLGEVRDHNPPGGFFNRLHQGSKVYTKADAEMYKTDRSLGYAHANFTLERMDVDKKGKTRLRALGVRYGWFMDPSLIDTVYESVFGQGSAADYMSKFSGTDRRYASSHEVGAKLELIMNELYAKSRALADAVYATSRNNTAENKKIRDDLKAQVRTIRDSVMTMFRDHHGIALTDYSKEYQYAVNFDDLQILRNDGTRGFDRSALVEDMPDPDSLTDGKGFWLAGTTIGLPRTPSYNGSMWCQSVRLSTPCTEYETEEHGQIRYRPGKDAMVMPDPQTLKILGCDHDGDKTMCYFLTSQTATGTAASFGGDSIAKLITPNAFNVEDDALLGVVEQFIDRSAPREAFIAQLLRDGWITGGGQKPDPVLGINVREGYTTTPQLANAVSNQIVQSFFDMSRNLKVDPGDTVKDFYGTPMARATRAQPLDVVDGKDDPRWKKLKEKSLSVFNYLKNSTIDDSKTNSQVSTSAGIADKARGSIVSWAGVLHMAQYSGLFNDTLFKFSSEADRGVFLKWVSFIYGVDGVSNATFDDIKEQICLRVGWTPGMVDTFISDIMFSYDENGNRREPPTTSDELYTLLDKYVSDIAEHKSRFWMMIMSEPSDSDDVLYTTDDGVELTSRRIHERVWSLFGSSNGAPEPGTFRSSVIASLGLNSSGENLYIDSSKTRVNDALKAFVSEYVLQVNSVEGLPHYKTDTREDVVSRALRALVSDISRRNGTSAASGYIYWIAAKLAKGTSARELVHDYITWSNGIRHLNEAREFAKSFNMLKADPGSGTAVGGVQRMREAFNKKVTAEGASTDVFRELAIMYAANICAYSATDAATLLGSGVIAANARTQALGKWANAAYNTHNPFLRQLLNSLFAEPAVSSRNTMQLEGQATTIPFFLAALVDAPRQQVRNGTNLLQGGFDHVWEVMETMASSVSENTNGEPSTFGFHKAFLSLYGALYGLASTSVSSSDFSGLYYLREQPIDGDPSVMRDYNASPAAGQLVMTYRDTDQGSLDMMWAATDAIASGRLDQKLRRTDLSGLGGITKSSSFVLSTKNLEAFLAELNAAPRSSKNTPPLVQRVTEALKVTRELDKLFGKEVEISPSTLVNQLFPLYATSVARSSSPDPKSRSVLNTYRGLFARLSSLTTKFDSGILENGMMVPGRGESLMSMIRATDLAVPLTTMGNKIVSAPSFKKALASNAITKADLDSILGLIAGSETDSGLYTYENDKTLNELLAKIRGGTNSKDGPRGSVRRNPKNRHFIGFLEGTQLLRSAHAYIESVMAGEGPEKTRKPKEMENPAAEEHKVTEDTGIDPDVQNLANLMSNVVSSFADVVYEGGDTFTIRSRNGLKGSAATLFAGAVSGVKTGARVDAVIQVHVGGENATRKVDINSPAFAASFCNAAKGLQLTAEQFLGLTEEERQALVNVYCGNVEGGVANFALNRPSWSVSSEGIATLCGAIQLGKGASAKKMYHEYFHSMLGMFRTIGVLGEEDIKQLQDRYGKAVAGSGMEFNEEKAADEFAAYVDTMVHGAPPIKEKMADGTTRSIFHRILDVLKSFFERMKNWKFGFQFADVDADGGSPLFSLVLNGYAATSRSRSQELGLGFGTMENMEKKAEQLRLNSAILNRLNIDNRFRVEGSAEAAASRRLASDSSSAKVNVTGAAIVPEAQPRVDAFHNALLQELAREVPRKAAVRTLIGALNSLRYGSSDTVNINNMLSGADAGIDYSVDPRKMEAMNDAIEALRIKREQMFRESQKAAAQEIAPFAEIPLTSTTVIERADTAAVMEDYPELDEITAEPLAEIRAGVDAMADYDPIDRGNRAGIQTGERSLLNAAANAARTTQDKLDPVDVEILQGRKVVNNSYNQLMANRLAGLAAKETVRDRAVIRAHGRARAAASKLDALTGEHYSNVHTINVLTYLSTGTRFFQDSANRTFRQQARAVYGTNEGNAVAFAARYTTADSMAGALMAAGGRQFGSLVDLAIRKLEAMRPLIGRENATANTLSHVVGQLRSLLSTIDITTVLEDNRSWQRAVDMACRELFSGINRGKLDINTGLYGDYVNADAVTSEIAQRNQDLYQFTDDAEGGMDARALRQKMLRTAADAIFITAAQVKFMNEFGINGGQFHFDAWTGQTTKQPLEFSEMTQNFGVGMSTLASGNPIIAQWNQPAFIAANLDDWYTSTVRESFGSLPVREMMMNETSKLRGQMAALVRKLNFLAMYWGLNRPEDRKLLRLNKVQATHELTSDFIQAVKGDKTYEGFTNDTMVRDTIDQALNRDQYRDVVLVNQLARALMNGDDKIITGIDRIRFSEQDLHESLTTSGGYLFRGGGKLLSKDALSIDAINQRVKNLTTMPTSLGDARNEKYRSMTPLEMTLYRLSMQWQASVTGLASDLTGKVPSNSIGLYNRFVTEVLAAGAAADAEVDASGLKKIWRPGEYNDYILRYLEGKGLVVATATDESLRDPETKRMYLTEATLCINEADINRMWEKSEALEILAEARTLDDGSNMPREELIKKTKANRLTAKAIADELGDMVKELKKTLKDTPWLTGGEAKYLHRFDSMIETVEGAGSFMYHALRAERNVKREETIRMGRHELTWQNLITDMRFSGRSFKNLTGPMLDMVADYFETDERGDALRQAMERGKYAAGTTASVRTGLVINPPSADHALGTMAHEVATQVYRKQLERRLMLLENREIPNPESEDALARMIRQYEDTVNAGDSGFRKVSGLTGTQLYRLHGSLPANFTAGHAVLTLMRGLQDSLHWRSALVNMLFTPDAEGDPMFLMSPDRFKGDEAGLSDGVWKAAAQWWASRLGDSVKYDIKKSGKENAREIFEKIQSSGKRDNGTYAKYKRSEKRYASLGQDDIDGSAIAGVMAMVEPDDGGMINRWGSSRGIFSLDGSEALGYARQLFQTSRLQGSGRAQWLKHILAWSKTMSVAYSVFFPISTKWESPTAAVGALATLGSNLSPEFLRKHGAAASAIQKFFTLGQKEGWIDENFIGYKDIIRMMDTNDPFLSDLVMWAESIGVTMSDNVINPLEPHKGAVMRDVENLKRVIEKNFGDKAGNNFSGLMDALLFHQSEKTFGYLLNATKLAVAAQVALRVKAEARRQGKAFDPIRDMRGYAEYVDSEVGGVNPMRFAWAHPQMRRVLNHMWFSWQWTRTAWEAAGGGIVEDVLFGGHAASKAQRGITLGRWLRMYFVIMHGLPLLLQFTMKGVSVLAAAAMGLPMDPDDDRDKWFTWENDSKNGAGAFNMDPILKLVTKMDNAFLGGRLAEFKQSSGAGSMLAGAAVGAMKGFKSGGLSGAVLGSVPGAILGSKLPDLVPEYTGMDPFNTNHRRQIFGHFGKQGWEPIRWFTDPVGQFFSKLNPGVQALVSGVLGFNPGNPDIELGMADSLFERLLPIKADGVKENMWSNMLSIFRPFSMSGTTQFGDAGILNIGVSTQMGSSKSSLIKRAVDITKAWADDDRAGYSFGTYVKYSGNQKPRRITLASRLADVRADAKAAGIRDFDKEILIPALGKVVPELYKQLFNELPHKPNGDYDQAKVREIARKLHRLGRTAGTTRKVIIDKYLDLLNVRRLPTDYNRRVNDILRDSERDAFDGEPIALPKMDY